MLATQLSLGGRPDTNRARLPVFPDLKDDATDLAWIAALARPELGPLKKLVPTAVAARRTVKLDANECPLPLTREASGELGAWLAEVALHRYGDDSTGALRAIVAGALNVKGEQLCFGHGSYELIGMLIAAFGRPRAGAGRPAVLFPTPTFFGYRSLSVLHGAEPLGVPLGPDLALDLPALHDALSTRRPNLAFFCCPNNPTGTLWPLLDVLALAEAHPDVIVVVDEVYCAYAGSSALDLLEGRPNLVLLRSLSKVGGAALRVGFAVGHPAVVGQLERARPPFTINALSAAGAAWLLTRGAPHVAAAVASVVAERARVETALLDLPDVDVFPSKANFLLLRVRAPGGSTARTQALAARGILVSDLHSPGALAGCLRVSIGSPADNDLFLASMRELSVPSPLTALE